MTKADASICLSFVNGGKTFRPKVDECERQAQSIRLLSGGANGLETTRNKIQDASGPDIYLFLLGFILQQENLSAQFFSAPTSPSRQVRITRNPQVYFSRIPVKCSFNVSVRLKKTVRFP